MSTRSAQGTLWIPALAIALQAGVACGDDTSGEGDNPAGDGGSTPPATGGVASGGTGGRGTGAGGGGSGGTATGGSGTGGGSGGTSTGGSGNVDAGSSGGADASSSGGADAGGTGDSGGANILFVINEVTPDDALGGADWIEFKNAGTQAIDISGWWFIDDDPTHTSYVFPDGTVVGPGAYIVVSGADGSANTFSFSLSTSADAVNLFDDQDTPVDSTEWFDGQATAPNSWGRSPDGTGTFDTLSEQTQGLVNAAPL